MGKPVAAIVHPDVRALARRAQDFVAGFSWCRELRHCELGFAVAGVLGIFRVELIPARDGVDPTVWAIVGDLPPAYIAYQDGDTWRDALEGYVDEMQAWVDAVRLGESVDALIPVNVAPTAAYADILDRRLGFLREHLLAAAVGDLEGDT